MSALAMPIKVKDSGGAVRLEVDLGLLGEAYIVLNPEWARQLADALLAAAAKADPDMAREG